jgi:hypothetical protein
VRSRSRGTRAVIVAGLVPAALAAGGAANAYWSGSGSGAGAAATGTTTAVQLNPGSPTADLYPGGTSSVVLTLTNPNQRDVRLNSLGLDASKGTDGFEVDSAHAGCAPLSVLSLVPSTNGGAGWDVPARVGTVDGTLAVRLPGALSMSTQAVDACQGAVFTVYLSSGP